MLKKSPLLGQARLSLIEGIHSRDCMNNSRPPEVRTEEVSYTVSLTLPSVDKEYPEVILDQFLVYLHML